MQDVLPGLDEPGSLSELISRYATPPQPAVFECSTGLAKSVLQKAVRRGETQIALTAATTLLEMAPDQLWRRMVGIAMEDVGHGSWQTVEMVTRLAHSRARVSAGARRAPNTPNYVPDPSLFTLIPVNARRAYARLVDKQPALQAYSEAHAVNALTLRQAGLPGILVSGLAWNYLNEAMGAALEGYNVLRVGMYPLPVGKIRQLLDASGDVFVVEEGYPFIERYISALGLMQERRIRGRMTGDLPRTGELGPDAIRRCFGLAVSPSLEIPGLSDVLSGRPPRLCDKCPHTDAYIAIKEVIAELGDGVRVMGDIGCYSLGYLEPHQAIHSCLCMGSSIGMAIGAAHAGMNPSLCVIGDGTFTHSGMAPLLDAARENINIKVFILDNSIVAMTGGQPTTMSDEHLAELVTGLGVKSEHVRTIVPLPNKRKENLAIVKEELAYEGLSVIIARRACVRYVKEIKEHKRERDAAHHHDGDCANCTGNC